MDEQQLGEKLSSICPPQVNLPVYQAALKHALKQFDASLGNAARTGGFFVSLRWQQIAITAIAILLVASLAVGLPSLNKDKTPLLATDIALANPQIQAALGGFIPVNMAVTDNFGAASNSRVVMVLPPEEVVVADVNMDSRKVTL